MFNFNHLDRVPRAYPPQLRTIGDHLRRCRLDLRLLQRELADRLGVDESTVTNWEINRTTPALRFLPPIIDLLGFDPRPADMTLGEQLVARILGVDPGTLWRWESGQRQPQGPSWRNLRQA